MSGNGYNGNQGSSSRKSTSGNPPESEQSEQPKHSSSFKGGWGSRPSASGGWGSRPAASGGWGSRPAASGGWGSRPDSSSSTGAVASDQQHRQPPPQPKENDLFGIILRQLIKRLPGIDRNDVIAFAKDYTKNVDPQIADSPSSNHVETAYQAMLDAFFDHDLFAQINEHGICPRTVSEPAFQSFMGLNIFHELTYLVKSTISHEDIVAFQRLLCSKNHGVLLGVLELMPDHSFSLWKQKTTERFVQRHPLSIMFVCVVCHGFEKQVTTIGDLQAKFSFEARAGSVSMGYNHLGQLVDSKHLQAETFESKALFIPSCEKSFGSKLKDVSDLFKELCDDVMTKAGAKSIPFSSSAASSATEVPAPSLFIASEKSDSAVVVCYHGEIIKSFDKFTECKKCTSGKPGKMPIKNNWGDTVGYKSQQ